MGAADGLERLVRAGGYAVRCRSRRASAVRAQALSRRSLPPLARFRTPFAPPVAATQGTRRNLTRFRSNRLEHDPEKWTPVFGKDHAPAITRAGWRFEEK